MKYVHTTLHKKTTTSNSKLLWAASMSILSQLQIATETISTHIKTNIGTIYSDGIGETTTDAIQETC